ncbi:DeoR/GlpR family DNA-binding transcription regulator [Alkalicoccobacillus gibsonii]|uniref:DeoR/GlpR family DNA-binding transcription regulator n=1 Tax=Alkalicoccobacillus gibsonii TaxID=79881 RepID=A0ABU9VGG6_9BACI|nr:DeoR/GlpR family DNA-binding transcription regulator [Alkalicoccobacillus gibsonii]MBM0064155.1 DeoR/GlpR transcriptional regulator [Alkalicoccobacillus gibsonii]
MDPKTRRNQIQQIVEENGKVEIDQLTEALQVSHMTVRRDLALLEEEQKLIRTHGGAVLPKALVKETPYVNKETKELHAKRSIAKESLSLIGHGATILVDSGTTTFELVRLLKDRDDLTIITNDIKIAAELVDAKPRCIVTGGEVQSKVGALYGAHAYDLLRSIHVDLFILGAHAVHQNVGVTAPTLEKAKMKQLMIEAAEQTWLVCDTSKFNEKSFAHVCELHEVEGIVTDDRLNDEELDLFHQTRLKAPL